MGISYLMFDLEKIFGLIKNNWLVRLIWLKAPDYLKPGHKAYTKFRELIKKHEHVSKNKIKEFQLIRLKQIVNYAWENIEGYRELWASGGFSPKKLKSLEDIRLIPFVTKELIRDNLSKFSNNKIKKRIYSTTGGSTGIPFGFYLEPRNISIETAFIHDLWSRQTPSISRSTRSVILRGDKTGQNVYRYSAKSLILSSYDINLINVKKYLGLIEKFRAPIFQAYPSAIFFMAKIMKEHSLVLKHRFVSIMLGSEPLCDFQRKLINETFGTKISHWYGATELVVLAGNCEVDSRFHVYPQYGITEVVDGDGNCVKEKQIGEIVGTSFWNMATPFIRYKTKDYAELGPEVCEKCKRAYQLLNKIDGRLQEFIVGKNHQLVSMTAVNMHDDIFDDLELFRFYQDVIGKVTFNYIKKASKMKVNEEKIYKGIKLKLGEEFDLDLKEVEIIEKTKNGNLRFLDQKLDINNFICFA